MKIYLAAPWESRVEINYWAGAISRRTSHEIVSTWHSSEPPGQPHLLIAENDLAQLESADALMFFLRPRLESSTRRFNEGGGGRHVEFGYALALGRKIFLIGDDPDECVFHAVVPEIRRFSTVMDFIDLKSKASNE